MKNLICKIGSPNHQVHSVYKQKSMKQQGLEKREREREMFSLTTHSTHFIYGYMVSDIWLRTILIVRKETRCRHIGYSFRLTARVLLYAPSHRQDSTYDSLCCTSRGTLEHWLEREIAQWVHPMKDRSDDPSHHERTLLPRSYISLPFIKRYSSHFIYCYMSLDILQMTIQIVRGETRCHHYMGQSFRLAARDVLYAPSHRQDSTYHGTC